jgi:hypothetical protein
MRAEKEKIFLKLNPKSDPTPTPIQEVFDALFSPAGLTTCAKTDLFTFQLTSTDANHFNQLILKVFAKSKPIAEIRASQPQFAHSPPYTLAKDYRPESRSQYEHSGAVGLGQSLIIQALLHLSRQSQVEGTIETHNFQSIQSRLKTRCLNTQKPSFYPTALIPTTTINDDPGYKCISFFGSLYKLFDTPFSITEALNLGTTLQQSFPLILNHSHKLSVFT